MLALAVLFVLSGAAGLIYESVWARYLGLLVGHSAYAQIIVLVIFLGGMAIGSFAISRWSERIRSPLLWYAAAEAAIGLFAFLFHPVFVGTTQLAYERLLPALSPGVASTATMWTIAALLILPQSILLGATFPLMTAGATRLFPDRRGSSLGLLYFANSFGAAIGALIEGFVLIGAVGLDGTLRVGAALNFVVAIGAFVTAHSLTSDAAAPSGADVVAPESRPETRLGLLLIGVSFATAFSSFFYEIAWTRMLSLVYGSATHSFEIMLSAFVLGLASGALWISRRADRTTDPIRLLAWLQWGMGVAAIATLPLYIMSFHWTASLLTALPGTENAYRTFSLARYGMTLVIMLPATFCAGTTLPLITKTLMATKTGESSIGLVYGVNTVGSILGAAIAALVLVPLIGLKWLLIGGGVIDIAVGIVIVLFAAHRDARPFGALNRVWAGVAATAAGIALLAWASPFQPWVLASGVYRYEAVPEGDAYRYLFYRDGRTASVSVRQVKADTTSLYTISTNGKPDASVLPAWIAPYSDAAPKIMLDEDMSTQMYLPILTLVHAPGAKVGAVIGEGSGVTSHMLLASSTLQALHTIEIEPEMIHGSRLFYPGNRRVFDDPRSKFEHEDARAFLATNGPKFDFILSEPSNPWVSGVSSLFTVEFYERAKSRLAANGVFVQWFHLYEIDDGTVASVIGTIDRVFPSYRVYLSSNTDIVIVAGVSPTLRRPDWSLLQKPPLSEDLRRFPLLTEATFDAAEVGGRDALHGYVASAPVNSDYRPLLDLNGERLRFRKDYATGFEDLGETRLDIPAALENRPRGFDMRAENPTPQIRRSVALLEGRQLRGGLAGLIPVSALPDSLHSRLIQLKSFQMWSSGSTALLEWPSWIASFLGAEGQIHGGTAGVADGTFYGMVKRFVAVAKAPPHVVATVNFYHGLAAWDFAEAAAAADVLLARRGAGVSWIPPATFRQGAALAKLKLGDAVGAREVYERLKPDSLTVADRVLIGAIDERLASHR